LGLHSYRYAWAERAKTVGYPERFAQMALGHNSKAAHRAYASNVRVTLPPLDEYEKNAATSSAASIGNRLTHSEGGATCPQDAFCSQSKD